MSHAFLQACLGVVHGLFRGPTVRLSLPGLLGHCRSGRMRRRKRGGRFPLLRPCLAHHKPGRHTNPRDRHHGRWGTGRNVHGRRGEGDAPERGRGRRTVRSRRCSRSVRTPGSLTIVPALRLFGTRVVVFAAGVFSADSASNGAFLPACIHRTHRSGGAQRRPGPAGPRAGEPQVLSIPAPST
jgi:hypothetical protein